MKIGERIIGSHSVELLGITNDNNLNFTEHVSYFCKKGNQKLHAFSKFLSLNKPKRIMRTMIESQLKYRPLAWMFHSRTPNNKINELHERATRLVLPK